MMTKTDPKSLPGIEFPLVKMIEKGYTHITARFDRSVGACSPAQAFGGCRPQVLLSYSVSGKSAFSASFYMHYMQNAEMCHTL